MGIEVLGATLKVSVQFSPPSFTSRTSATFLGSPFRTYRPHMGCYGFFHSGNKDSEKMIIERAKIFFSGGPMWSTKDRVSTDSSQRGVGE
jgi:hypothetical protein